MGKNYSNVGDMQMDYDSDEGEVLESNDDIIENEPNFKERVKGGNRDNLFTEVTDKSLKSHDDKESISASYLDLKTRGKYSVDHYSSKVKEALNTAKEKSHEFMDNKLGQETESGGADELCFAPLHYHPCFWSDGSVLFCLRIQGFH